MKGLIATCSIWLGCFALADAGLAQTLSRVDAGGGALSPPVTYGDHLYVGTGATIGVWDLSDPQHPVATSRAAPAPGPVRSLAIVGDYLYAGWDSPEGIGGITVYSLATPANPVVAGEIDDYVDGDYRDPAGLATSGHYVYVGDRSNGLVVLDATDPLAPVTLGLVGGIYEFDAMAAFGTQLLTSGTGFIGGRIVNVIDITDPAAPVAAGQTSLDGTLVLRAVLTDGYAIGVGDELLVYDLHDPANITEVFSAPIDQATGAVREGDTLYLVGGSGIQVWDFAVPSAATLLSTVAAPTFAPDQAADTPFGPLLLTHTDRGVLLDTSAPHAPTIASQFTLPFGVAAKGVGFDAEHAYIGEEGYGLGVADLATLAPEGRYDADLPADLAARDVEDVSVDGGRAYLAAWGYGVLIADLADPLHPVELGRFEFPFATAIEAHGDRVYVASSTNGGVFRILDVSDPAAPQQLGALLTSQTYDLAVRGSYAYLVDGELFDAGGLRVVDVSNPAAPVVVGQYPDCSQANGVDVSADGNTTYVACADDGSLRILDTSDRANPVLVGSLVLPGGALYPDFNVTHSVIVADGIAYVGDDYGLDEVDVHDPAAPVRITRHDTGYFVSKVERAPDGRVFAFAQEAGVFVFAPTADSIFADGFETR